MTNHWVDIKNADVILIMGSNAAENHPVAFKWIEEAKKPNRFGTPGYPPATVISVDPRFTRSSSKADIYAPMRSGTDIAFLGGMIRYAIWKNKLNINYIKDCTNALYLVNTGFKTSRDSSNQGSFSGSGTWQYQYASPDPEAGVRAPLRVADADCNLVQTGSSAECRPGGSCPYNCVFKKLAEQYSIYTPAKVQAICGTDPDLFEEICKTYCNTCEPDKSATMLYAMGWTQHTVGSQNIRASAILQSLLGNMGVAGGGINALRGWHNVQGSTDQGVLMHLITGYNNIPSNVAKHATLGTGPYDASDTYLKDQTPKTFMYDAKDGGIATDGSPNTLVDINKSWTTNYWAGKRVTIVAGTGVGSYLGSQIRTIQSNDATTLTLTSNWATTPDNTSRYVIFDGPVSGNWWSNRPKYVVSMLKAWWPTVDHNTSYTYLPKRHKDCSHISVFEDMLDTTPDPPRTYPIKGLFVWGTNPAVVGPNAGREREALEKLDWMVVCDCFETETASFWKRPGVDPTTIKTEVFLLPGAAFFEKKGSVSNSGRLIQWKDQACLPPGDAKDEIEILRDLGTAIKSLYPTPGSESPKDSPIVQLNWPYDSSKLGSDLTEGVSKEMHGYTVATGALVTNFVGLSATGTTACGNWLHSGTWTGGVNQMGGGPSPSTLGRNPVDYHPKGIGIFHKWGYSWPLNRRIIYNRASVDQTTGVPLALNKWVVYWDPVAKNWNGGCVAPQQADICDGYAANGPLDYMPFIMRNDGGARHMGIGALADGPFPEHWEPKETPLTVNPLTKDQPGGPGPLSSPYIYAYPGATYAPAGWSNIVCTTYRLTEHWHGGGMTRNLPTQCELMPEPFVEMSEDLADELGIPKVDGKYQAVDVNIYSARNPKGGPVPPVTVKACVTKRFKTYTIDGQTIHHVGMPMHWGYAGICQGDSANILTPHIGDANTRIPEYKAFLVKIEKA